ncbi:GbsR/MarR family transcriptional regulator [Streptomyces hygroscopicus]|uniref:GbsR/MarR family transcriptional regulator n=1 Tax=Streptomyces hygroscopicus TaxID=1912 RepID=UPI0022403910|nr:ArsR family transcriptional regulator [Streptomyces hygroscopicus]
MRNETASDAAGLPASGKDPGDAGAEVDEDAFVSAMGALLERWGLPQTTGRLFGYLLLRNTPADLDTMVKDLGQSKSGLSVAARQLESWSLVRRLTQPGSRRICYEAVGDVQHLLEANNAHLRTFSNTLRLGVTAARGASRERLSDLADLFTLYVDHADRVLAAWESSREPPGTSPDPVRDPGPDPYEP